MLTQKKLDAFHTVKIIGQDAKLNYFQSKLLHELAEKRFQGAGVDYIGKWAERIKEDTAWDYADAETRHVIYNFTLANLEDSDFPALAKHIISDLLPKA